MKRKLLSVLFAAAIAATGCISGELESVAFWSTRYVTIDPMLQAMTRVTELNFEDGDQVGVTITMDGDGSTFAANHMLTHSSGRFAAELSWYEDMELSSTLVAYYPYAEGSAAPVSFTVATDQSVVGAYAASDLLVAKKEGVTPSTSAVTMLFSHAMSRIVIDVDNQSGVDVSTISISGTHVDAVVDLANMTFVADQSQSKSTINVPLWSDGSYKAIIVPQVAALEFVVVMKDGSKFTRSRESVTFVSGASYKASLTLTEGDLDVSLSGDLDDWDEGGYIPGKVDFEEFDGYFIYDGVKYNTVTLSNGSTWMAENLAYLPEGYAPSADPTVQSDVWYPYMLDYDQMVEDGTVALSPDAKYVVVLTDAESIKARGYLYSAQAAFGTTLKEGSTNADFEGKQGICPPGWHIPTRADYFALVGLSNKDDGGVETGTQTNTDALFYDASYIGGTIQKWNDAGMNFIYSGYRNASAFEGNEQGTAPSFRYQTTMLWSGNTTNSDLYGNMSLNYYMTSTYYKTNYSTVSPNAWNNNQFFALMTTFTSVAYPEGRLTLAYVSGYAGVPIRCVKDAE